jgi:hypothetical protein
MHDMTESFYMRVMGTGGWFCAIPPRAVCYFLWTSSLA